MPSMKTCPAPPAEIVAEVDSVRPPTKTPWLPELSPPPPVPVTETLPPDEVMMPSSVTKTPML